ncbi:MAG: hypothetical protein ACJ8CR_13575, partial [Roseiflexaceae bacterium]
MRLLGRFAQHWPVLLACAAALLGLALLWLVHDMPLQPAPVVRIDALSAFFIFALLVGAALAAIARPGDYTPGWRGLALLALLLIAWTTTLTPIVVIAYLIVALLTRWHGGRRPTTDHRRPEARTKNKEQRTKEAEQITPSPLHPFTFSPFHRLAARAPGLVAAGALLVGYGALAMRGALRYDARTAGAALDGFAFWFVLLAAVIPTTDHRPPTTDDQTKNKEQRTKNKKIHPFTPSPLLLQIAWLYPLARLYSLGPWNSGWSFAARRLGGGVALWAARAAFARPGERRRLTLLSCQGMALAGFGLSSGAGVAAGCYAMLAYLVLALQPTTDDRRPTTDDRRPTTDDPQLDS